MKDMELVAAIDLGGTETKFGLVNRDGDMLAYQSIPTSPNREYEIFFDSLASRIENLRLSLGDRHSIVGISVGAPTGSHINGTIDNASNLNWPTKLPVADILRSLFDLPVSVANDANAAAIGEMLFGVARGAKNFLCVTLGTGLGCGLVVDGKLVLGSGGHAGELGHVTAVRNGRLCGCGRRGCLETYASATGIVRTIFEEPWENGEQSPLLTGNGEDLNAKKITEAARKGDPVALRAFDYTGRILGEQLANTVALLNPELIVLTGGLSRAGDLILEPTQRYMNAHLLEMYKGTVKIKLSEINTKKTAILGAAAFMWLQLDQRSRQSV